MPQRQFYSLLTVLGGLMAALVLLKAVPGAMAGEAAYRTGIPSTGQCPASASPVDSPMASEPMTVHLPYISTYCMLPQDADSLRDLAELVGLPIGAATNINPLRDDAQYGQVLAREFNSVTDEWSTKFDATHPEQGRYDFSMSDEIVAFAQANDMQVRGHTLVWEHQIPDWLTENEWTRDQLLEILEDHIKTVMGRYRGQIAVWDVVNEAFEWRDGTMKEHFWYQGIGPDYIELAFKWAREADPDVPLFYNDYVYWPGAQWDAIVAMVKDFKARGVPIDGVGLQMHLGSTYLAEQVLIDQMQILADLGVEVQITEMDIRTSRDHYDQEEILARQAEAYGAVLAACLNQPACTSFTMWGYTDKYSWLYEHLGTPYPAEMPLILNPNYQPKPAYDALRESLIRYYCQGH